jgi:hypothetical protein
MCGLALPAPFPRHKLSVTEPRRAVALLGTVIPPQLLARGSDIDTEELTTHQFPAETWPNSISPANDSLDREDDLEDVG